MALDFFLNELSYRVPALDVRLARNNMENLVALLSSLKRATERLPNAPQLRMHEGFHAAILAPDYSLAKWRADTSVDHVQRLFFKTYAARAPFLYNLPTETTRDFPEIYEYQFDGTVCLGLGYAHLLRGIVISLKTEPCWNASSIEVIAQYLTEHSDETFSVRIPHASMITHVRENEPFLVERLSEENPRPRTLNEMWERRRELFSHLEFCEEVEEQLELLDPGQHLNGVLSSLLGYNKYSSIWSQEAGEFSPHAMLHVTPESPRRLRQYREELTFPWNGQCQVFSLHGRFTPGAGRIHMWPELARRRLVIGYIGMKIGI